MRARNLVNLPGSYAHSRWRDHEGKGSPSERASMESEWLTTLLHRSGDEASALSTVTQSRKLVSLLAQRLTGAVKPLFGLRFGKPHPVEPGTVGAPSVLALCNSDGIWRGGHSPLADRGSSCPPGAQDQQRGCKCQEQGRHSLRNSVSGSPQRLGIDRRSMLLACGLLLRRPH